MIYLKTNDLDVGEGILSVVLQRLWRETYADVLPVLNDIYLFGNQLASDKYWALRRAVETLGWRGTMLLQNVHGYLFEGITNTSISSLHAYEVGCFNKGKLNKGLQFGRAYQLGRIGGNFLFVGECTSTYMPDAPSLHQMLNTHEHLFSKGGTGIGCDR